MYYLTFSFRILSLLFVGNSVVSATYYIEPGNTPSDLNHSLDGTLMYSIDKHRNTLILTFADSENPLILIVVSPRVLKVNLRELCNCSRCRYEVLDLRIQMRDKLHLRCNNGEMQMLEYKPTNKLNYDKWMNFISVLMPMENNITGYNWAHLWLFSQPQFNNVYPNSSQLSGCVFNVWYNDQQIIFTRITDNIVRQCNKSCSENICNAGICYETYHKYPACNCTQAFLNGRFCNDSIGKINTQTVLPYQKFSVFKVSWRSSGDKIFELINLDIRLHLFRRNSEIIFQYRYIGKYINIISIMPGNYVDNSESIFIAWFRKRNIEAHYYNNGSWYIVAVPTNADLSQHEFTSITLTSCDGVIDFVYKNSSVDYDWKTMDTTKSKSVNCGSMQQDLQVLQPSSNANPWLIPVILVPVCIVVVFTCVFIFLKRKRQLCNVTTDSSKVKNQDIATFLSLIPGKDSDTKLEVNHDRK